MYKLITSLVTALIFSIPLLVTVSVYGEKHSEEVVVVEQECFEGACFIDISEPAPIYSEPAEEIDISETVCESAERAWYDVVKETDYISEPLYYDGSYFLSDSERDLIERTVMHEAGWCPDYRLLILTAQCIRNGCERFDQTPLETFDNFGYAAMSYANPRSKKAVSDVFDKGIKCVENDIFCYYNSTMVDSPWHEEQQLAIDIDGNRFFY